jgi:DNA polymerase III delta subunit
VTSSELKPVYLLTGSDLPKIGLALRRLRARFDQGSIEHFAADSASGETVVAAANALGLFGGGERLVIVESIERWKKDDAEAVVAYLNSTTYGSVVALAGDPGRLPGLEAACAKAGDVLRYDLPFRKRGRPGTPDYVAWAVQQLERAGLGVGRDVAERLVELVGDDVVALQSEIEKLVTWSEGASLDVADVERLVAPAHEENMFAMGDAWGTRDEGGALAACEAALLHDEPFRIAGRLADHVRGVRAVHHLLEEDLGTQEIAARLGLKEFPARKRAAQAANFSAEELELAVVRLAALDHALKGGSRLDPVLELERALAEVSTPPDRRTS